jgi:hypothetical protein
MFWERTASSSHIQNCYNSLYMVSCQGFCSPQYSSKMKTLCHKPGILHHQFTTINSGGTEHLCIVWSFSELSQSNRTVVSRLLALKQGGAGTGRGQNHSSGSPLDVKRGNIKLATVLLIQSHHSKKRILFSLGKRVYYICCLTDFHSDEPNTSHFPSIFYCLSSHGLKPITKEGHLEISLVFISMCKLYLFCKVMSYNDLIQRFIKCSPNM